MGTVHFENLYERMFHEPPTFVSGFTVDELVAMVKHHAHLDEVGKKEILDYLRALETMTTSLQAYAE